MPTPDRLLLLAPLFATSAFAANLTLTGQQAESALVLSKGNTYTVKGEYVVPAGKKLEIGPGALISADRDAKITVKGELLVNADAKSPAIARGKAWQGIHAVEKSKVDVTGLQVSGAKAALHIEGSVSGVKNCVFAKNETGLKLVTKGSVVVDNCLFAENTSNGFRMTGGVNGLISNCSFLKNKGFGLTLGTSQPKVEKCLFMDNEGAGFEQSNPDGSSHVKGSECSFDGKGLAFALALAHGTIEFPKCYWGEKNTKILQSKGEKAVLPNVKDARNGGGSLKIFWAGFLTSAPKPCGATVASKL